MTTYYVECFKDEQVLNYFTTLGDAKAYIINGYHNGFGWFNNILIEDVRIVCLKGPYKYEGKHAYYMKFDGNKFYYCKRKD